MFPGIKYGINSKPRVSVTLTDTGTNGASQTTYTFSSKSLGDEHKEREIFVTFSARATSARSVSSVTIGGVNATVNDTDNQSKIGVARVILEAGTTGNIVITFSGSMLFCVIAVYRVINRKIKGASFKTFNEATNFGQASLSLNVPHFGFCLAALDKDNTTGMTVSGDFVEDIELSDTGAGLLASRKSNDASGTKTINVTWSTNATYYIAAWSFE